MVLLVTYIFENKFDSFLIKVDTSIHLNDLNNIIFDRVKTTKFSILHVCQLPDCVQVDSSSDIVSVATSVTKDEADTLVDGIKNPLLSAQSEVDEIADNIDDFLNGR